eukprot:Tbor_TRINITY_DN2504_c0_g1::TRINITY_DN2504_c0_g1_i1::g.487::m.487/K14573/NOP4, RBM28; nucleolar protein 4
MALKVTKKKPTPSAIRKAKASKRIRKQSKRKIQKKKPSWKASLKKTYTKELANKDGSSYKLNGDGESNPNNFGGDEVQDEVDEEKMSRLNKKDPLETQLFLKGLPVDVTDDEVNTILARYGPIKKVLLVRNRMTKMCTGTGFVHCGTEELAEKILAMAKQNAREVSTQAREDASAKTEGLSYHQSKKLQYKLRGNVHEAKDPFITVHNSRVTVHRVLSRTDSHEVTAAMQKKKKRTKVAADDPRHLYLLQEGRLEPGTPAAKGLPPQYVEALERDYMARKEQLMNINMFVSKTRLNIRNIPVTMEDSEIRALVNEHARKYLKLHPEDKDKEKWGKYGPLKNIKILRDNNGKAKGYAFVEFINHNISLAVLRSLNNNPNLFGSNHRLVVSFAVENINAVQKLARIRELKKVRLANKADDEGIEGDDCN